MRKSILDARTGKAIKVASVVAASTAGIMAVTCVWAIFREGMVLSPILVAASAFCVSGLVLLSYVCLLLPVEVIGEDEYLVVRFLFRAEVIHHSAIRSVRRHLMSFPFDLERVHLLLVVEIPRLPMRRVMFQQDARLVQTDYRLEVSPENYRSAFDEFLNKARELPADGCEAGPYRSRADNRSSEG